MPERLRSYYGSDSFRCVFSDEQGNILYKTQWRRTLGAAVKDATDLIASTHMDYESCEEEIARGDPN